MTLAHKITDHIYYLYTTTIPNWGHSSLRYPLFERTRSNVKYTMYGIFDKEQNPPLDAGTVEGSSPWNVFRAGVNYEFIEVYGDRGI